MTLRQRQPRHEDPAHLKYVRKQPCCLPFCRRQAEAAHLRMANPAIGKRETGGGERPSDSFVVALCPYHHRLGIDSQHNSNEREWWQMRGIDPWPIAASLWIESGGAARALEPKRAPTPRKIKDRKPREQRAKIRSGRKLVSNPVLHNRSFEKRRSTVSAHKSP